MMRESRSRAAWRVETRAQLDEVTFVFAQVFWRLPLTPDSRLEELG
jgi:hypothetical protein